MSNTKTSAYFRHCEKPTLKPIEGATKGSIPTWLEGTLIRNGPGIHKIGAQEYNHAFDGLAVLHRVHIADGKATYSNRPLESDTYKKNMEAQRIVVTEFGTRAVPDPCAKIFSSLKTDYEEGKPSEPYAGDNCSVNVGYYGDQLYAMTEGSQVRRISPESLLPIGDQTVISDYLAINTATAHPHVLENGNILNVGNHYTNPKGPHYAFFEVPPKFDTLETSFANAKKIAEIPATEKWTPSYFHSFGITKNRIVFIESPLRVHLSKLMSQDGKRDPTIPIKDAFHWHSGEKTRFILASMENGENHSIVYETDDLLTFHHANAYEEDGHIVVDVAGYSTGAFVTENMEKSTIDKVFNNGGSGRRYVLPLTIPPGKSGNLVTLKNTKATATVRAGNDAVVDVTPEIFLDAWFEFPKINYKFNGLKYRYLYGVTSSIGRGHNTALPEADTLVKIDLETAKILSWAEKNVITPEPVFVANPNAPKGAEDDGVIIAPLLHTDELKKVTLLILNAKNFEEVARVEFQAAGTVPATFHGQWANERDQIHLY